MKLETKNKINQLNSCYLKFQQKMQQLGAGNVHIKIWLM